MKSLSYICMLMWALTSYGKDPLSNIKNLKASHPGFVDTIVKLQNDFLRDRNFEHVLGIGFIYRTNFSQAQATFRVDPFLMEAYSLIQFCRYEDAKAVLSSAEYYAKKFSRSEDLLKIEKAKELEKLSQLYKNLTPHKNKERSFSSNELQWEVSSENEEIFKVIDNIVIRAESLCR